MRPLAPPGFPCSWWRGWWRRSRDLFCRASEGGAAGAGAGAGAGAARGRAASAFLQQQIQAEDDPGIAQFMAITGQDKRISMRYLEMAAGSVDTAVSLFYDGEGEGGGGVWG